jgi:hypothetical protein
MFRLSDNGFFQLYSVRIELSRDLWSHITLSLSLPMLHALCEVIQQK